MKTRGAVFLFFFLITHVVYAQKDTVLARRVDSLETEGRKNKLMLQQADKLLLNKVTRESLMKKAALTDSLNYPAVEKIFQRCGYPGYDLLGKKSSHNFWVLVQQQDRHPGFQDSVLMRMKPEVEKKNASAYDYAVLTDRVKLNAKQLQVYGTQLKVNKDSTSYEPKPVIEPEKLNERRRSLGLSTIEEYIQSMNSGNFDKPKKK